MCLIRKALSVPIIFIKSRCFKCLLFYYLIRTIISKKAVANATKSKKNTKNVDFLVKVGYNN